MARAAAILACLLAIATATRGTPHSFLERGAVTKPLDKAKPKAAQDKATGIGKTVMDAQQVYDWNHAHVNYGNATLKTNVTHGMAKVPPVWCKGRRCHNPYHHHGGQGYGVQRCDDMLFNMLVVVAEGLTWRGVDWVLCWGTLLGAERDQDIIPWTADVDICLTDPSYQQVLRGGRGYLHHDYAFGQDQHDGDVIRGCGDFEDGTGYSFTWENSDFVYMDLYNTDQFYGFDWEQRQILKGPKKQVNIRGHMFNAPMDSERYLEIAYGPSWRTPNTTHSAHGLL